MTWCPINPYSSGKDIGTPAFAKNGTPIIHLVDTPTNNGVNNETSDDTTILSIYDNNKVDTVSQDQHLQAT